MKTTKSKQPKKLLVRQKTYFFSDAHLGLGSIEEDRQKEMRLLRFLNLIQQDAAQIYIVGDLFDYWFEYKSVVPKKYFRLFAKFAELTEQNIRIFFIAGNHDFWVKNYFRDELGIEVHFNPVEAEIGGKRFLIHHGDGLLKDDLGYTAAGGVETASPTSPTPGIRCCNSPVASSEWKIPCGPSCPKRRSISKRRWRSRRYRCSSSQFMPFDCRKRVRRSASSGIGLSGPVMVSSGKSPAEEWALFQGSLEPICDLIPECQPLPRNTYLCGLVGVEQELQAPIEQTAGGARVGGEAVEDITPHPAYVRGPYWQKGRVKMRFDRFEVVALDVDRRHPLPILHAHGFPARRVGGEGA